MEEISKERMKQINRLTIDRSNMFYWQVDKPMTMDEMGIIFGGRSKSVTHEDLTKIIEDTLNSNNELKDLKVKEIIGSEHFDIGSVNINRKIVFTNGRTAVGRFHPRNLQNGYFSVEASVAKFALNNSIKSAIPLLVHCSQYDLDLDFILFENIDGQNMKTWIVENPTDEEKLVGACGQEMAKLHNLKVEGYGFFDNEIARHEGKLIGIKKSYKEHCLSALDENLRIITEAGYINTRQSKKIVELFHNSKLLECQTPSLIHNDMADWNVIVKDGELIALIDWDECHGGDPIADIACWSLFFPIQRLDLLLNGYKKIRELPNDFDDKLHIYRLRYVIAKMALRYQKYSYDKSELMEGLLKAGSEALRLETQYFNL